MLEPFLTILFSLLAIVHIVAVALFFYPSKTREKKYSPPVSVIIPAHNEERFIVGTIKSVLVARYSGKREIIVVDDGSSDDTAKVVKKIPGKNIRIFSLKHGGKARALNFGIKKARYDTVAYIDADSHIEKNSLERLVQPLAQKDVAASSGIIRVRYSGIFSWFQDIDYIISSGWRYISSKINSTYVTPGFAVFKKSALNKIEGFSTDTLTEDIDVTIRLKKLGFHAVMSDAVIFTSVPSSLLGFVRQRARWGRGSIQVAKKHRDILLTNKLNYIGTYTFPMHLFWYAFAILYVPFAFYWFLTNLVVQPSVLTGIELVIKWFTAYGIADLVFNILIGTYSLSGLTLAVILAWLFSFSYLLLNMGKFGFTWRSLLAYLVIFPYYWLLMIVQAIVLITEGFSKKPVDNRWKKRGGN